MNPAVSVIIVTWNALPLLRQCFPSVAATQYDNLEIVVADNASTDGSVEWLEQAYPSTRVIRHPENWRFARGNNEAIRQTTSPYVVLLNNDVEVTPDWLKPLVREMNENPDVAAAQPKLLRHDHRDSFEYAGASGGFIDFLGYPFTRGRIFDTMEDDRGQYDDARDVFWASGAAMMLRRSAIEEVGLLDEQFEMHMEEIDLCWRLHRKGYRVRVVPESIVHHIGGGSLPKGNARKTYYNFRNSLLMLYKNISPSRWVRLFPVRAAMDMAAAGRALVSGAQDEAKAILQAYSDAHRMKEAYADARPSSSEAAVPHVYTRSIAADYFLRGLRTFSQLDSGRFTSSGLMSERQ